MNPEFNEFPHNTYEQWKKAVTKELGERPFESLIWQNPNGFAVEPYRMEYGETASSGRPSSWNVFQSIAADSAAAMNKGLLQSLMGGVNAVGIDMPLRSKAEMEEVLKDIHIEFISTHFLQADNAPELAEWFAEICAARGVDSKRISGSVAGDPFADYAPALAASAKKHYSLFRVFSIDQSEEHDQGAEAVHELAAALSKGHAAFFRLMQAGITADEAAAMLQFNFSTSSSYFTEIAKYRAFRLLWKTIAEAYHPQHSCSARTFVHASTSRYLQTVQDPHNNLLRATTQAMSAIIGGVDSLHVLPHTANMAKADDDTLRLARNIQHLLTEESHLDAAGDIASGSFYIEDLTAQLANKAWEMFVDLEKRGGWPASQAALQEMIAAASQRKKAEIAGMERIVVGVNKYQDKKQTVQAEALFPSLTADFKGK